MAVEVFEFSSLYTSVGIFVNAKSIIAISRHTIQLVIVPNKLMILPGTFIDPTIRTIVRSHAVLFVFAPLPYILTAVFEIAGADAMWFIVLELADIQCSY